MNCKILKQRNILFKRSKLCLKEKFRYPKKSVFFEKKVVHFFLNVFFILNSTSFSFSLWSSIEFFLGKFFIKDRHLNNFGVKKNKEEFLKSQQRKNLKISLLRRRHFPNQKILFNKKFVKLIKFVKVNVCFYEQNEKFTGLKIK